MADLYGFDNQTIKTPLTADKATITWQGVSGEIITGAVQVSISYAQAINRRRSIGNKDAIIWSAMPSGQITIQRLLTIDSNGLFSARGWKSCDPGTITLTLGGGACDSATQTASGSTAVGATSKAAITYTATGCIVSQFNVQAEAESLTVMDNVVIEFLQLSQG
jgi:hypothetical protein